MDVAEARGKVVLREDPRLCEISFYLAHIELGIYEDLETFFVTLPWVMLIKKRRMRRMITRINVEIIIIKLIRNISD